MGIRVTGAELEIMQYLWKHPQGCTFAATLAWFNESGGRTWSKQTLNTYLLRLSRKGLLERKETQAKSVYVPAMTELHYNQLCAEEILEESYGGGLACFIAALSGCEKITEEEEQELMKFIEKKKRENS